MNNSYDHKHIYDQCEQHMHAYVLVEMKDGMEADGIITGIDHENVYMAVPIEDGFQQEMRIGNEEERQFGHHHGGYSHGGYGGYSGYGGYGGHGGGYYGGYGRPRRFNRLILPLAALTAVSLLPWY